MVVGRSVRCGAVTTLLRRSGLIKLEWRLSRDLVRNCVHSKLLINNRRASAELSVAMVRVRGCSPPLSPGSASVTNHGKMAGIAVSADELRQFALLNSR